MSFLTYRINEKLMKLAEKQFDPKNSDLQVKSTSQVKIAFDLYSFAFKTNFRLTFASKPKPDCLNIGFVFSGGLGDQIISAQWVKTFLERLIQDDCNFYAVLCFPNQQLGQRITQGFPHVDLVESHKYFKKRKFDVLFNVDYFVKFWAYNREAVAKFAPKALTDFDQAFTQLKTYSPFNYHYFHFQLMVLCVVKGLTRYDLMGDNDLCHFDRNTQPFFEVDDSQVVETMAKFDLQGKSFITLHSGVGSVPLDGLKEGEDPVQAKQHATRVIPQALAEDIFAALKAKYPDIVLVQLGELDGIEFKGADLNLVGKTSLMESLNLVYAAAVHIDNDSGLIHARHAMGKRSVVLWGPTYGAFVGYPEDENLQGSCKPCMWLTMDWNLKCPRHYECARCMAEHKAADVMASVTKLLSK